MSEKQAYAWNEYTKRSDGGYVHTYFYVRQLPADRIVPVTNRIAECTGENWRGIWNDAAQAAQMRLHFLSLQEQGATHVADTLWSTHVEVKFQHYNTPLYPMRDSNGQAIGDKLFEQYCEPSFSLPERARELDASYALLKRLRRAVKHWNHPQELRDALTRMRAHRVHSLKSSGYHSDWCVVSPAHQQMLAASYSLA
jgi:hypothetical protein